MILLKLRLLHVYACNPLHLRVGEGKRRKCDRVLAKRLCGGLKNMLKTEKHTKMDFKKLKDEKKPKASTENARTPKDLTREAPESQDPSEMSRKGQLQQRDPLKTSRQ